MPILIVLIIGLVVVLKFKDRIFVKAISSQQTKPRRKGCKVIKIRNVVYEYNFSVFGVSKKSSLRFSHPFEKQ